MPASLRSLFSLLVFLLAGLALSQTQVASESLLQKPFVPNNRWALVIGVSGYKPEIGPLRYTSKEAREFSATLTDRLQFEPSNVRLFADGGAVEETPTSGRILAALDSLLTDKRLDKANLFVFYFSGHGVGTPKGDFLLPVDATKDRIEQLGIPVSEVISRIVNAGLKNVLFIADACRAGTQNDFGQELTVLCKKANIAVLLGCAPGKRSYEYSQLKRGAFTHFLLESLANKDLRDQSGSLWASKLGREVQTKVHDYTEPDHGKFAQVPALWSEQSTLDVLLGTYVQPPVSDEAVKSFRLAAGRLDKSQYAASMTEYAAGLLSNDRYDQAVDLLKAVDQLGELTPEGRYLLATSLAFLGRAGESERVLASFQGLPESFYKDLATASSTSKSIDPKLKVAAAFRIFNADPVWNEKLLAWAVVHEWGNYDDQMKMAKMFAALPESSARHRFYAVGSLADVEGHWAEAVAAFKKARQSPGDAPTDATIFYSLLHPILGLGDTKALDAFIQESLGNKAFATFAYLEKAALAKKKGDANARVACLKAALVRSPDPDQIWLAAKIAGPYIGMLQPEFKSASERHPYSWRARIVLSFIRHIGNPAAGLDQDALAADRYQDDPLNFYSSLFDLMDSFMVEAIQLGRLKSDVYRTQLDAYFLILLDQVPKFGYSADLWGQFAFYGMFNERNAQVNQIAAKALPFSPADAPRDLRPLMMMLAMNRGDHKAVANLSGAKFEPGEGSDPTWMLAMYEATRDRWGNAEKLIKGLPEPSERFQSAADGLKAYLLAKAGKKSEARSRIPAQPDDPAASAFYGLALAELGDWKKAEPLLAAQTSQRMWNFLFVQEYALSKLDARYRSTGRLALSKDVAMSALISQPGNPLFDKYSFTAQAGKAQFAGSTVLDGLAVCDRVDNARGKLSFDVAADGTLSGVFLEASGKKHEFSGQIDGNGNFVGKGEWEGKACRVMAKIAPASVYKSYPGFRTSGQLIQMVDTDGFRIALLGRAKN